MQIAFHVGAHATDEDRILRSLLKERGVLAQHGIAVPSPKRYRSLIRDSVGALKGRSLSPTDQAALLGQIMEEGEADRLVLSWDSFLCLPPWALKGRLYPGAPERVQGLCRLLSEHELEFHLALRNPAGYLPHLFAMLKTDDYAGFMAGVDPADLNWSELVMRLLDAVPGLRLTIWCDEDSPLIWPEILRAVSGLPEDVALASDGEFVAGLLSGEGLTRMNAYLLSHPPANALQRRKIVSAFLDKFALPEKLEVKFTMPGWNQDLIEEITDNYEEDVARIAAIPEVDFITT